jgi:hypothetical protein
MPFIQVTWDATEPPIRQTVSVDGADDDGADADELPDAPLAAVLELPELQPAMASAAAAAPATAPSAADLFLSPTAGTPSARVNFMVRPNPFHPGDAGLSKRRGRRAG